MLIRRANHARKLQGSHQPHGAHRQLRTLLDGMIPKDADLQASAAKIRDAAGRRLRSQRGHYRFPAEARFLSRADHFQPDS
jgi:hypothetical protein